MLKGPTPTIREGHTQVRRDWKAEPAVTGLRATLAKLLEAHGGVMAADDLAQAVLLSRGSVQADPALQMAAARAATRGALEAEQAASAPRFLMRRVIPSPPSPSTEQPCAAEPPAPATGGDGALLVGLTQELMANAESLGWAADRIAVAEPLAPPHRVLQELRAISAPPTATQLATHRLLRLAASASRNAAVLSRQELYPRGREAQRALILAQGSLLGEADLTVDDIRSRVAARYPEAQPLPDVPELAGTNRQPARRGWIGHAHSLPELPPLLARIMAGGAHSGTVTWRSGARKERGLTNGPAISGPVDDVDPRHL